MQVFQFFRIILNMLSILLFPSVTIGEQYLYTLVLKNASGKLAVQVKMLSSLDSNVPLDVYSCNSYTLEQN